MTERIYAALDAARQKFPTIVKNRTNPHFKSRYADLNAILEAVEGPLRDQGLVILQRVSQRHDLSVLNTVVFHRDAATTGDLFCDIPLPDTTDPQKLGSAITYARRYGIVTLLGLVTEDDDDGAAATLEAQSKEAHIPHPAPTIDIPLPDGWFSPEDMQQAHNDLVAHIKTLPEAKQAEARKFREENSWPLPVDLFNALKLAVGAA